MCYRRLPCGTLNRPFVRHISAHGMALPVIAFSVYPVFNTGNSNSQVATLASYCHIKGSFDRNLTVDLTATCVRFNSCFNNGQYE